jgi:sugar O-acyltransferase (sialic acid O-acetyltransferase NeuD family)
LSKYKEIYVPKETVSDEIVKIVEINIHSGSMVKEHDCIFSIETSKSVIDIESPISGTIVHKLKLLEDIPVGELAAIISSEESPNDKSTKIYDCFNKKKDSTRAPYAAKNNMNFSKKALELIDKEGIDKNKFENKSFVRVKDVENLMNERRLCLENGSGKFSVNDVVLIGGGGHAKMCIDIILRMKEYNLVGIVDNNLKKGSDVLNIPIIGSDDDLQDMYNNGLKMAVNGVGSVLNNKIREEIYIKLKKIGFFIPTIVHPTSTIESSVKILEGAQIMMGALVGSNCTIGNNCIISSGSIVSHDSFIGSHAHIAPGAVLGGNVVIENGALVGMGATIFFSVRIGVNSVINNGLNIFSNIENDQIVREQ